MAKKNDKAPKFKAWDKDKQLPAWMFKEYHEQQKEGARDAKIHRKIDKAVKKVTSKKK